MTDEQTNSNCETCEPDKDVSSSGCCDPTMEEAMQACPCGGVLKNHRTAVFTAFAAITLVFLISQIGGVCGTVAFLRTF